MLKHPRLGREIRLLIYLPVYLLMFFLVERLNAANYWVSHCALDARIPFVPAFVTAYVLWYPLMLGMAVRLLRRDPHAFVRYAWMLILGMTASILTFLLFPSVQNLRPAGVPGRDVFSLAVRTIYALDTNTNVFPSMHVVGTMAALIAGLGSPAVGSRRARAGLTVAALAIIFSTVFIKQHSVLDVLAGIALAILVWPVVYRLPERLRRGIAAAQHKQGPCAAARFCRELSSGRKPRRDLRVNGRIRLDSKKA